MLTVQMVTHDNASTVRAAIESLTPLGARVVVADLGSTDGTRAACRDLGTTVLDLGDVPRHTARNKLLNDFGTRHNFWMQPWEVLASGHRSLLRTGARQGYATVVSGGTVAYDVRVWDGVVGFTNHAFEQLDLKPEDGADFTDAVVYSRGGLPPAQARRHLDRWKAEQPLAGSPYYYEGCLLFAEGRYDDFLKVADHYLFADRSQSVAATMTRYYYALAQTVHRRAYRPALQNLNLCLCAQPLMAEFWCLTGDVHYHLLRNFEHAKEFYENALHLGPWRKRDARWPMDIPKYRQYPEAMLRSCREILGSRGFFAQASRM